MKNKELIEALQKFSPELEVKFGFQMQPRCDCEAQDIRCYCQKEEQRLNIHHIDEWKLEVNKYSFARKLKEPIVLIQSEDSPR